MAETEGDPERGSALSMNDSIDPLEVYQLVGQLGEGAYGSVWHAKHRETGTDYAVKVLQIETDFEDVRREIEFMKSAAHPNVCQYFGSYYRDPDLWIVMEYCSGGSCADMMRVCRRPFNEQMISAVIRDTLRGLSYIHSLRKIHRDIKAGNILVNNLGDAKIADFGVSGELTGTMSRMNTVIGSPFWMAPEIIMEVGYSSKVDIWSLGVTCIELAETLPPLAEIHPMRAIFLIPSRPPPTFTDPSLWSRAFNDFICRCLQKDPAQRATADELLTDSFIVNASSSTCMLHMLEEQSIVIKELGRAEALGIGEEYIADSIATQSRVTMLESTDTFVEKQLSHVPMQPASLGSMAPREDAPSPPANQQSFGDYSSVWKNPRESVRSKKRRTVAFATPDMFLSKRASVHGERMMVQQMLAQQAAEAQGGSQKYPNPGDKSTGTVVIRATGAPAPQPVAPPAAKKADEWRPKEPEKKERPMEKLENLVKALEERYHSIPSEQGDLVDDAKPSTLDKAMEPRPAAPKVSVEQLLAEKRAIEEELKEACAKYKEAVDDKELLRRKYFSSLVLSIKLESQLMRWVDSVTLSSADLWEMVETQGVVEDSWREFVMRALAPEFFAVVDSRRSSLAQAYAELPAFPRTLQ